MKKKHLFALVGTAIMAMAASNLQAATISATLTLSDVDGPQFSDLLLINNSTSAQITNFTLTIGNTDYGFDRFLAPLAECGTTIATCTLNSPDNIQNNIGEPAIDIDFTGFDPTESLNIIDIEVDFASGSANDYDPANKLDVILFNNGASTPNGTFSVSFSTGETLSLLLPDGADAPSYTFTVSSAVVPVPAAAWLFASGLVWLTGVARRKKPLP